MTVLETVIPYKDIPDDELTIEQIREKYHPIYLGPTWQKKGSEWLLPERTLGWEIAGWTFENLNSLDEDEERDEDVEGGFRFTLEQLRFVLWWYAVDEKGKFAFRKGVLQRLKGWGKDPLLAVLCIVELVGPAKFSHFNENGEPVGKQYPQPLVVIAAVNQFQTNNTTEMFPALMGKNFMAQHDIQLGVEVTRARGGKAKMVAVTSSPRPLEGMRPTFAVLNETHHWLESNKGHKMYEVIDRNIVKRKGRYLAITNAYLPGEESVAQKMREAYEKNLETGTVRRELYDSVEAPAHTSLNPVVLQAILPMIRGDSVWLDIEDIIDSILDNTISVGLSRRFWLNQVVADEDALYGPADWQEIVTGETFAPGDKIVLGFDGGKTDDSTALVGVRISDGMAMVLGLWEKPEGPQGEDWQVDREAVDSAVHDAFRVYEVYGFYADVALWESYIADWSKDYGEGLKVKAKSTEPIAWDMRQSLKAVTMAHEGLVTAVYDRKFKISDSNPAMKRHFLNVRRRVNKFGVSFGKESKDSKRKIDLYAALLLAHICRHDYFAKQKPEKEYTRRGWFM